MIRFFFLNDNNASIREEQILKKEEIRDNKK